MTDWSALAKDVAVIYYNNIDVLQMQRDRTLSVLRFDRTILNPEDHVNSRCRLKLHRALYLFYVIILLKQIIIRVVQLRRREARNRIPEDRPWNEPGALEARTVPSLC